jgi:hypothetical protein
VNRAALILGGAEIAEHAYADSRAFFAECCDGDGAQAPLTRGLRRLQLDVYLDEEVPGLLKSLAGEDVDCLILSTNALYSPVIAEALLTERDAIEQHVERGGGLIVLPQPPSVLGELSDIIGGGFVTTPANQPKQAVLAHQPDDILLRFPERVDSAELARAPETRVTRLFWGQLAPDPASSTTILYEAEREAPVLARSRTGTGRRVVLSAIPFDWRRERGLARNALYFATCGPPFALMLTDPESPRDAARARFMSERGGAVVREPPLAPEHEWLLREVDLAVIPPNDLDWALERPSVRSFLRRGGTLTAIQDVYAGEDFAKVTVIEGNRDGRLNVELVISALAAQPDWGEQVLNDAIGLRAIVACLRRGREILGPDSSLDLPETKRQALIDFVDARMAAGVREDNVVAVGARADTLAFLGVVRRGSVGRLPRRLLAQAHALGPERELQLAVSLAILGDGNAGQLISDALAACPAEYVPSVAEVSRWSGAVASADRVGRLDLAPGTAVDLALMLTRGLQGLDPPWLTTDVSAEILIGLAALLQIARVDDIARGRLARPERILGIGNVYLRRLLASPSAEGRNIPWRARLSEALLLAEDVSPLGLEIVDARRRHVPGLTRSDDTVARVIGELREENVRMTEEIRKSRAVSRGPARLGLATGATFLLLGSLAPFFGLYELLRDRSVATGASVTAVFLVVYSLWFFVLSDRLLRYALLPDRVAAVLQALMRRRA